MHLCVRRESLRTYVWIILGPPTRFFSFESWMLLLLPFLLLLWLMNVFASQIIWNVEPSKEFENDSAHLWIRFYVCHGKQDNFLLDHLCKTFLPFWSLEIPRGLANSSRVNQTPAQVKKIAKTIPNKLYLMMSEQKTKPFTVLFILVIDHKPSKSSLQLKFITTS